jgi:hypothetical protein
MSSPGMVVGEFGLKRYDARNVSKLGFVKRYDARNLFPSSDGDGYVTVEPGSNTHKTYSTPSPVLGIQISALSFPHPQSLEVCLKFSPLDLT